MGSFRGPEQIVFFEKSALRSPERSATAGRIYRTAPGGVTAQKSVPETMLGGLKLLI
jgi:hypothetical protein